MADLAVGFQSLPEPYQEAIRLAQQRFNITVTPLQALTGGFSGAIIYLVSVSLHNPERVEHFVLKLDRKSEKAKSDEIRRHTDAVNLSPEHFGKAHIAQMVFDRIEQDGVMAIFYAIAGQSLHHFRPLSTFDRQSQLETLFVETYHHLLDEWNEQHRIQHVAHPQQLLKDWLGFRIQPGGSIENFLASDNNVPPDIPGLLVNGAILPNPLAYARDMDLWGAVRPLDVAVGLQHSDLNTNNILVKFDRDDERVEGFYLIDFALFKENTPLLFDLRYLEASYLVFRPSQASTKKLIDLITGFGEMDHLEPQVVPVDMAGVCAVINASRQAFETWINHHHPTLRDDLWGQYLLAGVAAGLNYTHKAALSFDERLVGLVFSAANLKRFATLFGLSAPAEGRQIDQTLQHPIVKTSSKSSRTTEVKGPHNLPAEYSSFVGREEELAEGQTLILNANTRLVTFTGPGGVGKTRMALRVAAGLLGSFPDGIYLVQLAEITEPDLAISRIAQTLGVRASSRPVPETLKEYLQDKKMLLLLDNLEQVTHAAPAILDLLAAAPGLKVLGTSRIMLNVRGEHVFNIPPMKTPSKNGGADRQSFDLYEAVQLFVERAQAANPHFTLNKANAQVVGEICEQLDGLPLAIELSAARVKLFTPQALLSRLNNRLAVLTGGARDLPIRQQTLRNTLDWSYSLLSSNEQVLFARLGIFVGGFSLEAVESICNPDSSLDTLAGVESLMNNSLIHQIGGPEGQPRFRMLETMREYALERLIERGELSEFQEKHGAYYVNVINHEAHIFSPDGMYWLNWLEVERDNINAVLTWGQSNSQWIDQITQMMAQLVWFWYRRGYFEEGHAWTEKWLKVTNGQARTTTWALALQNNAWMSGWRGDLNTALSRIGESLEIWLQMEDEMWIPRGLFSMGVIHINMGNDATAHPMIKEAQRMFEEGGSQFFNAASLIHLGNVSLGLGHPEDAKEWLEKASRIICDLRDDWMTSFLLNNQGEVARVQGDYENARQYYQESETLLRAMDDKGDLARLVNSQGYVAHHAGQLEEAREKFHESLAMFRRLGNKRGIAEALAGISGLKSAEGRPKEAAQLLGYADSLMAANGASWWPADRIDIDRIRAEIENSLGQDAFNAEWAKGKSMDYEQAIASAVESSRYNSKSIVC